MSAFSNITRLIPITIDGSHCIASVPVHNVHASTLSPFGQAKRRIPVTDEIVSRIRVLIESSRVNVRLVTSPRFDTHLNDLQDVA